MRYIATLILSLLLAGVCCAITVEEVAKLSELKTSDDVILSLIQKNKLDRPVTTQDIIYLQEHGVSERVLQYVIKLSEPQKAEKVPQPQEESAKINDNLRTYTTTGKDGKKVRVVTNLDESGNRMGNEPPAPPQEVEEYQPPPEPVPPQEIHVTVSQDQPYPQEEEPPPPDESPYYNNDYLTYPYYPAYYPPMVPRHCPNCSGGLPNANQEPHWRANGAVPHRPPAPVTKPQPPQNKPATASQAIPPKRRN